MGSNSKSTSPPFEIARNEKLGRHLIASRDIPVGEIIFREDAIMLGPKRFSKPICLGCHRAVNGTYFCTKCGFPMCSSTCQNLQIHANNECQIFGQKSSKPKKLQDYNNPHPLYQCILPLRMLLLRRAESPILWDKLNAMEHHTKERKTESPDVWHMHQVNIVEFLRGWCGLDDFDEETIHRVIGYIDVNCFHVKTMDNIEISGMYELGSIPCQDCVPNTHHAFTKNCQLIFRSSIPIKKGEEITMSYAPVLMGTLERRAFLKTTKYFDCDCPRCKDPTEIGTFLSGIKCLHCPSGYLLPEDSLQPKSNWVCYNVETKQRNENCLNTLSVEKVLANLDEMRKELESVLSPQMHTNEKLERALKKCSTTFVHQNHFLLIPILQELNKMYNCMSENCNDRQIQIVTSLLEIAEKLQPGYSRIRGVLIKQMCSLKSEKIKMNLQTKKITQAEYDSINKEIQERLRITEQIFALDRLIGAVES